MKKIISLVIAAMMAVSMFAVTVPAMAANVSSPSRGQSSNYSKRRNKTGRYLQRKRSD